MMPVFRQFQQPNLNFRFDDPLPGNWITIRLDRVTSYRYHHEQITAVSTDCGDRFLFLLIPYEKFDQIMRKEVEGSWPGS
jgi:hypothetical protein